MVDKTIELIVAAIFSIGMIGFWLALCHMVFLAYCRQNCRKNSSEQYRIDKTQAIFRVTKGASGMSESPHEDLSSSTVTLLNEPFLV